MPIYEYLCDKCNRVFNFMARNYAETQTKQPICPKCGSASLKKMMSRFAVTSAANKSGAPNSEAGTDGGDDGFDDPRVEREMMKLMNQAESIDENDPRQLGHLMRKMSEITGEKMAPEMAEAIRRLEKGEDPEKIEAEMGDLFGDDEGTPGAGPAAGPSYDDGLYSF